MPRVNSSAILRVHYTEATRELAVTFVGGRTYVYLDVPREIYAALLEAPSKGQFVNAVIKEHYAVRPGRT